MLKFESGIVQFSIIFFIELEHALDSKTGDFEHASQMLFGVILAIILLQLTRKVFFKTDNPYY